MQKRFTHLVLAALFVSPLAMSQALQTQQQAPVQQAPVAPPDAAKTAAIADLLKAIDADKLAGAIGNSAQMQAKQLVPAILSDALSENKTLTDEQKQAAVPTLQQNEVPKLVNGAGQVFASSQFHSEAVQAQKDAYNRYYTTAEIKDLTKFYTSSTGKKFIEVQDQVGRDVVNGLMQKYMPQSIQATRTEADRDVASVKPAAGSATKSK